MRAICSRAASGLMCGSRPLPEVKTMSAGTGASAGSLLPSRNALALATTLDCSAALVGPKLLAPEGTVA